MPGIEARAPERTETSKGALAIAEPGAYRFADRLERPLDVAGKASRKSAATRRIGVADLGCDREAGWNRQAEACHLGEIRTLATEQVAQFCGAIGMTGAK